MLENQPRLKRRSGLTDRQVRRRACVEAPANSISNSISSRSPVLSFGKSSKAYDDGSGGVIIEITKDDILGASIMDIQKVLGIINSPIPKFMKQLNGDESQSMFKSSCTNSENHMMHFGMWMNNVGHYSGGRVHALIMAYQLAEMGHKVTIVTDKLPSFTKDLRYFDVEDRVEFIYGDSTVRTNWLLKAGSNNIDAVIVIPRIMEGFYYARKWNLPCYAVILETPNYVCKFRNGADATEEYWAEYKNCIKDYANFILCNPGPTMDGAKEWLKDFGGSFFECPPAINTYAADKVDANEENEVTFVGRHLDFKCPDDIVKALSKIPASVRPAINFIGSHNDTVRRRIQDKAAPTDTVVRFYAGIDDFEKYSIIKRSKLLIFPSCYEGFGMPPAEALYCKKAVVAYELPILRHIYGDSLEYVKSRDFISLGKKVRELLENPEKRLQLGDRGYLSMFSKGNNIPCLPFKNKNILRNIFYGKRATEASKITAGIIVLNGIDTLRECLDSIYDSVEKIVIVEGAVFDYAKNNPQLISQRMVKGNTDVDSIDGTEKFISHYIEIYDHLKKIELVKPPANEYWNNKNQMQNEIAKRVKTPLYLKVDADEIWRKSDIEYCCRIFQNDPELTVMYMRRWHFWKDLKTVAVGGQWDSAEARMWRFPEPAAFHHDETIKGGFNYYMDKSGDAVREPKYKAIKILKRMHYHLGYCRNAEHIKGKIRYYANRGIEKSVEDNYSNWKPGQPTNSTHPNGTSAVKFTGTLPLVLRDDFYKFVETKVGQKVQNNLGMLNAPAKE